jgi:hypothetical protein
MRFRKSKGLYLFIGVVLIVAFVVTLIVLFHQANSDIGSRQATVEKMEKPKIDKQKKDPKGAFIVKPPAGDAGDKKKGDI